MATNGNGYAYGAYESYGTPQPTPNSPQVDPAIAEARAWITAHRSSRAALTPSLRAWVLDTSKSLIDLFPDRERTHLLAVNWSSQYFPNRRGLVATESERLFNALAALVPERRVNNGSHRIQFRAPPASELVTVSGRQRLWTEAAAVFQQMSRAAGADGVTLTIGSGYRARQGGGDGISVAAGVSTHNYGLAMDLHLSVRGLSIQEITTGLTFDPPRGMQNVVSMYRSPMTKWMALNGAGWGWYPYRREPWHWEYNPAGFKERFEQNRPQTPQGQSLAADDDLEPAYGTPLALFQAYRGGLSQGDAEDPGPPVHAMQGPTPPAPAPAPTTRTFTDAAVTRMRTFLVGNADGGHPQNCISTMNEALRQLFGRTNIRMGSEVQTTMGALHDQGLASDRHDIEFLDAQGRDNRRGVVRPATLRESVLDAALALAGNERGWSVFGLSIMDGNHSVLLSVDNRDPQNRRVYWSDQWASRHGWQEFSRQGLDTEVTTLTQRWWDQKPQNNKPRTRATLWRVLGP